MSNVFGVIGKFIRFTPQYLTLLYLYNEVMIKRIFEREKERKCLEVSL